jgi:hypothetical protein
LNLSKFKGFGYRIKKIKPHYAVLLEQDELAAADIETAGSMGDDSTFNDCFGEICFDMTL